MNLLEIAKKEFNKTGEKRRFTVPGEQSDIYEVYSIPLEYLYYNDQNGRVMTAYKKYIAENGELIPEIGNSKYNDVFEKFIFESNPAALNKTKDSIEERGQTEPGVVLPDGRVIDGNRRFTSLRKLAKEKGVKKEFLAVILPLDLNKSADIKTITEIELDLQFGREEKVTYNPIDRILLTYNTIKITKTLTMEEYRDKIGAGNTNGINRELRVADLIIRFIEIVSPGGNPIDKFHLARELDLDGPLKEVEATIHRLKSKKKDEIIDAVMTYIALIKTNLSDEEPKMKARKLKSNILQSESLTNIFLDAINKDDRLDTIIDSFQDKPLKNANDLAMIINESENLDAASRIMKSVNNLILKGQKDEQRTKILSQLESVRDDLEGLNANDFEELKTEEKLDSRSVLSEIRDLLYKLEKDLNK